MIKPSYVVGIGASAGGLEAIQEFFNNMPNQSGMAFVVIQHLSPDFKSMMAGLLQKNTKMPIVQAENEMSVAANHVYLIPPKTDMTIRNGDLILVEQQRSRVPNLPINLFFNSLALDYGIKAVAIVLSGTGSDGSKGVIEVNENGGLVITQDPASAKFDGMPLNAIGTKTVNKILRPFEMPDFLQSYVEQPSELLGDHNVIMDQHQFDGEFAEIFRHIFDRYSLDLEEYKPNTINRRIIRRIRTLLFSTPEEYVKKLEEDPSEVEALFQDIIIGVTSFFRDEDAYDVLRHKIIPEIIDNAESVIRIWVCACSTGEEAYSLAMLIEDHLERHQLRIQYKIFATDLVTEAIQFASQGVYKTEQINLIHYEGFKDKYFVKNEEGYQICTRIRNNIVFSVHNVLAEPPFTRLDFVTCRNMLIYFNNQAQKKVLGNFHFGLKQNAHLFLGSSESLGKLEEEFAVVNSRLKIFKKIRDTKVPLNMTLRQLDRSNTAALYASTKELNAHRRNLAQGEYDSILQEIIPDGLIVNDKNEVTHVFGTSKQLLNIPDGRIGASNDIATMIVDELKFPLTTALMKARKDNIRVLLQDIMLTIDGKKVSHELIVKPTGTPSQIARNCLVLLTRTNEYSADVISNHALQMDKESEHIIADLQTELQYARESLNATIEEVETSNEELQSTNEELLASNEELQSTNEELQSVNEELYTVNSEHQLKIRELQDLNRDIDNLLLSTQIGTIFVNNNREIRKFTPAIQDNFHIIDNDIGRSIEHFTHDLNHKNLSNDLDKVLQGNVAILEREVTDSTAQKLLMRITPYRDDNDITGAVLSFVNITSLKEAEADLLRSEQRFKRLYNETPVMMHSINSEGFIEYVSNTWLQKLGYQRDEVIGRKSIEFLSENSQKIAAEAQSNFFESSEIDNIPYEIVTKNGNIIDILMSATSERDQEGKVIRSLAVLIDVTEEKRAQSEANKLAHRLDLALKGSGMGVWDWNVTEDRLIWDDQMYALYGYERRDFSNTYQAWHTTLAEKDRDRAAQEVQDAIDEKKSFDTEFRIVHKDGSLRHIRSIATVNTMEVSGTVQMVGVNWDITKERELESLRQQEHLKMMHSARLANIGEMAAGIAHEINNPLMVIKAQFEILGMLLSKDELDKLKLENIRDKVDNTIIRISNIIGGLRNFSRDGDSDDLETVPINVVLQETLDFCLSKMQSEGVEFTVNFDEHNPNVLCRRVQLSQVLLNLIQNSRDAILQTDDPWVEIAISSDATHLQITVTDSGTGISEAMQKKIFDPFFTTKPIGEGTGLGLSISRGIIVAIGGELRYDSGHEHTRFTLELPLQN